MKKLPSQEYLREIFDYDPTTGQLIRRVATSRRVKVGDVAGSALKQNGYRHVCVHGTQYYIHRIIWKHQYGVDPSGQIDHISGDRDDNRLANLRDATWVDNGRNQKLRATNTSGHMGVHHRASADTWWARIRVDGAIINLGSYATYDEAVAARQAAEIEHNFHINHGRAA